MVPGGSKSARTAIAGLRRREELRRLTGIAKRNGIDAWIVGGAVRDCALRLEVPEVDVAVSRDAGGLARELEKAGRGRAVFISRDRPGPRVFRVAGKRPIDLAEIEGGSIASDLARRDFTVNAVAVALDTGEIVDPFGGLPDLARHRLRCVREQNLVDDPLRALRAARFMATHGLRPDRAALAASRRAAPLLHRVAPERIGAELSRLLGAARVAPALAWAARAGILPAALGLDLDAARAAALARSLAGFDDRTTRGLAPERRRRLRLALLAVRLGLGGTAARRWLHARRWGRQEGQDVARLAALVESARRIHTRLDAWGWVLEAGPLADDARRLLARLGPAARRRARRLRGLARSPLRTVRATGDDVVHWLGISSGPAVGELLARLRVAAAAGEVKDRRQARDWLRVEFQRRPVTGYNA